MACIIWVKSNNYLFHYSNCFYVSVRFQFPFSETASHKTVGMEMRGETDYELSLWALPLGWQWKYCCDQQADVSLPYRRKYLIQRAPIFQPSQRKHPWLSRSYLKAVQDAVGAANGIVLLPDNIVWMLFAKPTDNMGLQNWVMYCLYGMWYGEIKY